MEHRGVTTGESGSTAESGDGGPRARSQRVPRLLIAAIAVCAVLYVPFAPFAGTGFRAIFLVLAAIAGWQLGFWVGLFAAVGIIPLIVVLTYVAGVDLTSLLSPGGVVGGLVLV